MLRSMNIRSVLVERNTVLQCAALMSLQRVITFWENLTKKSASKNWCKILFLNMKNVDAEAKLNAFYIWRLLLYFLRYI